MNHIQKLIVLFFFLSFFACNNQQSNKKENEASMLGGNKPTTEKKVLKQATEKTVIKKTANSYEKVTIKKTDHSFRKISVIETSGPKKKVSKICEDLIMEILTTAPRYKQLTKGLDRAVVKNGGQHFGLKLEGSPDPKRNTACGYSKTFDFVLYEMYTNRQLNTTRFSFNPENKQLYEYDIDKDELVPIEFNKKLLPKYEALCE